MCTGPRWVQARSMLWKPKNQKLTAVGLDCTESKAKGLRHLTELTPSGGSRVKNTNTEVNGNRRSDLITCLKKFKKKKKKKTPK